MTQDPLFGRGIRGDVRRFARLALRTPHHARADADAELQGFLDERIASLLARGMTPDDARAEALRRLGGSLPEVRAALRRSAERREGRRRVRDALDDLRSDLRLTLRQVRRAPAFTAIAVLTIALGIGANTAIFSVVHHLLLAPLPYPHGNRIVALRQAFGDGDMLFPASAPLLDAWIGRAHSLEAFGALQERTFRVQELPGQDSLGGAVITPSLLAVLGVRAALGRAFSDGDAEPAASPVAIISTRFWRQQYAGRRDLLGTVIHLDGQPYTVIGVAPMSGALPRERLRAAARATIPWARESAPDIWIPGSFAALAGRSDAFARLRAGVSAADASRELDAIMKSLPDTTNDYRRSTARALRARDFLEPTEVRTIQVMFLAVGLLLLIACVNVANLLLARAWTRRRELAIRVTLGAGRGRLARQVLTESLALALAGGALGVLIASQGLRFIIALRPPALEHLAQVHLASTVLLWTLAIALATGVLFGAAPALFARATLVGDALRSETRSASGSVATRRTRAGLVVAEVALSLVLLVGAGLLIRAFLTLQQRSLGFEPRGLVSIGVLMPPRSIEADRRAAIRQAVLERLRAVPGVTGAAFGTLPGMGFAVGADVETETNGAARSTGVHASTTTFMTADYFRVARIALLEGRVFDATSAGDRHEIVINRALARRLWPDGGALGGRLRVHGGITRPWSTVIGVVSDIRMPGVQGDRDELQTYSLPLPQIPTGAFLVRTAVSPTTLVPVLRGAITQVDARLRVGSATTGDAAVHDALAPARFAMALLGVFAVVALGLAMVGLHGVIAYAVSQRTREIGVRVALGAPPSAVTRLVVGNGLRLVGLGLAIGLSAAAAASRVLDSLLYGMSPADPITYAGVAVVVVAIALVASYAPTRRALRIDPTEALRIG